MLPVPHTPKTDKTHTNAQSAQEQACRPGTWWKLRDDTDPIARSATPPDHGFLFLVEDVYIIDGILHSLVLHPHPLLGSGAHKLLIKDFFDRFDHVPEGAALRQAEIATVMATLQQYPEKLTQASTHTPTLALDNTESKKLSSLPVALSGNAAQAATQRAESALAVAQARKEALVAVQKDMEATANLLARYQKEQVDAMTASVLEDTKHATQTLEKLHTLTLFLGEHQTVTPLLQGASAPATERLHFFQRMLCLDEEFAIHFLNQDFDWRNINKLDTLLAQHPDIVTRLLPQPRCVVLARVRRHDKALPAEADYSSIFQYIQDSELNKALLILVRDGENVWMVEADQDTANAKRLFPSKAEIDALYTKGWSEKTPITPDDLDYSKSRSEHDQRGLFYKRFLVLFWGLHAREGLFGPFMPTDANWFDPAVQSTYFSFIHDEENTLAGPNKPLLTWMKDTHAQIGEGARILVDTRHIDHDACPEAFTERGFALLGRPAIQEAVVLRDGNTLYVPLMFVKNSYKEPKKRARVVLREGATPKGYSGILDLTHTRSDTINAFIENRGDRLHYATTIALLAQAKALLETEEAQEQARLGQTDPATQRAYRLARAATGWKDTPTAQKKLPALVRHYTQMQTTPGLVDQTRVYPPETWTHTTLLGTTWTQAGPHGMHHAFPVPAYHLRNTTLDQTPYLAQLVNPDGAKHLTTLLDHNPQALSALLSDPSLAQEAVAACRSKTFSGRARMVARTELVLPVGFATGIERGNTVVYALIAQADPFDLLVSLGQQEAAEKALKGLYKNAAGQIDRLNPQGWRLAAVPITSERPLHHLLPTLALDWDDRWTGGTTLDDPTTEADAQTGKGKHPMSPLKSKYVSFFRVNIPMEERRTEAEDWVRTTWMGMGRETLATLAPLLEKRGLDTSLITPL